MRPDHNVKTAGLISFLAVNLLGWMSYGTAAFLLYFQGDLKNIPMVLLYFLPYFTGFLFSWGLWMVFERRKLIIRPLKFMVGEGLVGAVVVSHLWFAFDFFFINVILLRADISSVSWQRIYFSGLLQRGIPVLAWIVIYLGIALWSAWERQKETTRKADNLAQNAQLRMLRYQLNPHFLFNALNSIRALIDEDEEKACDMVTELSEFLQYSLQRREYSGVALGEEMEAVQHYFAIQKKRYEDKLQVSCDISPQAADFPVLSFLIHPLVENAVKYGMQTSRLPLQIHVGAEVQNRRLYLTVTNSGRWVEPDQEPGISSLGTGTGLDNVRRRLENAFPDRSALDIFEEDGRVQVKLWIDRQNFG